jgi:hypothetical protein
VQHCSSQSSHVSNSGSSASTSLTTSKLSSLEQSSSSSIATTHGPTSSHSSTDIPLVIERVTLDLNKMNISTDNNEQLLSRKETQKHKTTTKTTESTSPLSTTTTTSLSQYVLSTHRGRIAKIFQNLPITH